MNQKLKSLKLAGLSAILLLIIAVMSCGTKTFNSAWRTFPVQIDGKSTDWQFGIQYLKKPDCSIATVNDDQFLYLCLETSNSELQQKIIRQGLIFWIDPEGGKNDYFGIKYPRGMQRPEGMQSGGRGRGERNQRPDPIARQVMMEGALEKFELMQPDNEFDKVFKLDELEGIQVKLTVNEFVFCYELKIPLKSLEDSPYDLALENGSTVGVGFEVPEMKRPDFGSRGSGEMDGGGMGMPGGGMGGGPGGMGGGGGRGGMGGGPGGGPGGGSGGGPGGMPGDDSSGSVKFWAKVILATDVE